ncbi:iron-containing alcohol dehydrogenase [Izhakiella australiensis]|uniref:iron-containing alcohol dehydrogenase n=1 Tax=Izhakiella australiensis TaxID=1926881 RepID=UPI001F52AE2A|nr:iron-containing alcohol dehydrogenase [Izhakiella australiensis]
MNHSTLIANRQVIFGRGTLAQLPDLLGNAPQPTLLFCNRSFISGPHWQRLAPALSPLLVGHEVVSHEASPAELDEWVTRWRGKVERVLAIGGGSVLDAAKAFAALCQHPLPCARYLEKIGDTRITAATLPLIAVPTTAGTGSEATQNAVVTDQQQIQVKASLRHAEFVPQIALLDADLMQGTPERILACCAIDAFTHLFESWLSKRGTLLTRQQALSGMQLFYHAWPHLNKPGEDGDVARETMLMASWLGGQCLGVAGLGVIHGIAGELGAIKPWHHGEVCGRLLLPYLNLLAKQASPDQQALMNTLAATLFPLQTINPALLLVNWLKDNDVYRFWDDAPTLTEQDVEWILARSNSKNAMVDYSKEQQRTLIEAAWPVGQA